MPEYFNKYLKYKFKYLNLYGGNDLTEHEKNIVKNHLVELFKRRPYYTKEDKQIYVEDELRDDIDREKKHSTPNAPPYQKPYSIIQKLNYT